MASRWPRLLPLLVALYLPFVGGGLLTDDFAHVNHLTHLGGAARIVDASDVFGFYRPITQASLMLSPGAPGSRPAQARALNVVLHAGVVGLTFVVARLVLPSAFAAGLATLTFALTPKAPAIAVLWISARGELLMALFSLAAIAAWIVWTRQGQARWLAAALVAYAMALLSKETATLLPLLLAVTPRPERPAATRALAVIGFVAVASLMYAWRSQTGALTPFSNDEHYAAAMMAAQWARNATNYAGRMLAAPAGLIALLALARLSTARRLLPRSRSHLDRDAAHCASLVAVVTRMAVLAARSAARDTAVLVFAAAFALVFLAPVLPIRVRSELYLYLPVFGVCLFAGWLGALLFYDIERRSLALAVVMYILGFGGYQVVRARDVHEDLDFSAKLIASLQSNAELARTRGSVVLIPADNVTGRSLQKAIGGYFYFVLPHALSGEPRDGSIQYEGGPPQQADLRLICEYRQRDGILVISVAP